MDFTNFKVKNNTNSEVLKIPVTELICFTPLQLFVFYFTLQITVYNFTLQITLILYLPQNCKINLSQKFN